MKPVSDFTKLVLFGHPYKDNSRLAACIEQLPVEKQASFFQMALMCAVIQGLIVACMLGMPIVAVSNDMLTAYMPYGMAGLMAGVFIWIAICSLPLYVISKIVDRMCAKLLEQG